MKPLSRKKKILGFVALTVFVLLLSPFVAVQIQERIFRHRAEQLLADMRSLMTHKGGLAEIQAVFERWQPSDGPCDSDQCWLQSDISYSPFILFLDYRYVSEIAVLQSLDQPKIWLVPFRLYGGRLAHVRARAYVERGVLYAVDYQIDLQVSALPDYFVSAVETQQQYMQYVLSAATGYDWRFSIPADWHGLTLHPDYFIEQGAPRRSEVPPPSILAEVGPGADPGDVLRLANFDFSCLTRLAPCRKPEDLMPQAAAQFAQEEPQLAEARKNHVCSPNIVALMARDAGRAGVVEVTGRRTEYLSDWGEFPVPVVRLIQDFEPANDWRIGQTHELVILDADTQQPSANLLAEVRPGNRFIMLAESHLLWDRLAETYSCGIVPLNPANLELVKQGIAGKLPSAKP